jgi:DNA helicase-2/ATP-dependent DNA helicase PcrA
MRTKYHDPANRAEDIERFMEFGSQYTRLQDFLAELALLTSVSPEDAAAEEDQETIKLSTIHQAKGLEWPIVFVISLAEGSFPNPRNIDRQEDEEEERRLFYVAVTRAKDHLYLCSPLTTGGHQAAVKPSRFIRELPDQCFTRLSLQDEEVYYYR